MTGDSDGARQAIESLAVKRTSSRFDVTINVRLRGAKPEGALLEELTVTDNIGQSGAMVRTSLPLMAGELLELDEVEGPFRARVEVLDAVVGKDEVSRANLRFLGPEAPERARELLRRLGVLSAAGQVSIGSEVPLSVSHRETIEEGIREALRGAPGSWKVEIDPATAFTPPWWLITIEGHGEWFRMSFRPAEQNPQFIHDQLRDALRRRGLVD